MNRQVGGRARRRARCGPRSVRCLPILAPNRANSPKPPLTTATIHQGYAPCSSIINDGPYTPTYWNYKACPLPDLQASEFPRHPHLSRHIHLLVAQ